MHLVVSNLVLFQLGWFACVLGAAYGLPWLGVFVVGVILTLHLCMADVPYKEMQLMGLALLVGGIWDSLMVVTGQLVYQSGMFSSNLAPYWILAMWLLFATTLNISLRWMKNRLVIAAILGAIFGPVAYYAGSILGAVSMADPLISSLIIGMGWFIIMPILMGISNYLDGFQYSLEEGA